MKFTFANSFAIPLVTIWSSFERKIILIVDDEILRVLTMVRSLM